MSEQRKLEIEKLKKQREYLTNPQNINFMKKYEENQERESGKEEGKKLGLHNGNIRGFETPYNQYQKNGYVNAYLFL